MRDRRIIAWLVLYAVLCAALFLLEWAKGAVEKKIKGEESKPDA